jgi:sodium/bile acid cotransporter 7
MSNLESDRPPLASTSETSAKSSTQDAISQMESLPNTAIRASVGEFTPEDRLEITVVLPERIQGMENAQEDAEHVTKGRSPKLQKTLDILKWFFKDQWFLVAMGFVILVSSQVQVPEAQQQTKRVVVTYVAVSVIL